jgi:hypothetical protein
MEALNRALTCSSLRPTTSSVIIDADAVEIAQPRPSKAASSTMPSPLTFRKTATLSPHIGLSPRAFRLASSG